MTLTSTAPARAHPSILYKVALGLALSIGLAPGAFAQTTTMRMSISASQNSHQGVGIDAFAKVVEQRTNGRIKIQNFRSEEHTSELQSR